MADRNDIIIKKADKGGAVVIKDVEDYAKEAEHQLNNKDTDKKLQHDPTKTITLLKNDKLITENISNGLQVQQPEKPKFDTRPKIHKTGNPGLKLKIKEEFKKANDFSRPANTNKG